ncbi:L-idonate 5-dehydrogenase [Klebsiella michiganensis]|uniref:L-idonate 5-dehydrogenase n=1 Tax=Klebsiella michiganensis TaxID=1134687 RepID=UPI000B494576|nr:L-idonate 5-dehydrogenase [Klebsiella michiganensis]MBZ7434365.1 L-idonate 5-dehydrogenase [Klebsiella michiganensis]MDM4468903.1 L-idonate 5-dehydrogenase [Klebsiella michiganensis]HBM2935716.1 L-idonate 5-dehydrogenase [Klebsiella michiganensis]HCT2066558.1 L-idonate 5-dehydrogenase [Klebsiella michiganensis]HED3410312.1 L-idonate 5-dehydrogenase [Klebsiella michiganensis]
MNTEKITCNACLAHAEKDVRFATRDIEYGKHDVLVKVAYGGICGSDIHYYQHGRAGMSILKHPMVIGHEFVGVVEKCPAESRLKVGQTVAINPSCPCNQCEMCLSGKQNMCSSMRFMGSAQFNPHVNGGFSEYVAVKPEQCIAYDSRVPANVMAFSEPLAVAIHAVKMAGQLIGKRVLVIGAGPIGCLILAAAKSAGASDVVACDLSPRCLELAQQMGATAVMDPRDEKRSAHYQQNRGYFDIVFEASGAPAAIASTVDFTRPTGTIVQVGMGVSPITWPVSAMLVKEINLVGSFRFIDEFTTAVRWLEDGRINPRPLISAEFSPDSIEQALITAADKNISAKVLIRFE